MQMFCDIFHVDVLLSELNVLERQKRCVEYINALNIIENTSG